MKKIVVYISVLLFCLGGCSMSKGGAKVMGISLFDTIWSLEAMQDKRVQAKTVQTVKLQFDEEKKEFFGNDGCNNIFGKLEKINETELVFGEIASTKMACKNMEFSSAYIQLFHSVHFYKIKNLHLFLLDGDKKIVLEYKKKK